MSSTPAKQRAMFLVDGFNLYHSIDDIDEFHSCKWLNIKLLAGAFLSPSKEELAGIFFFTALPTWNADKKMRHQKLLTIYHHLDIQIRHGEFRATKAKCRKCGKEYDTHQEKMTDMNICLKMLEIGSKDLADRIYLVTGDNDQVPAIKEFKRAYPSKTKPRQLPNLGGGRSCRGLG